MKINDPIYSKKKSDKNKPSVSNPFHNYSNKNN